MSAVHSIQQCLLQNGSSQNDSISDKKSVNFSTRISGDFTENDNYQENKNENSEEIWRFNLPTVFEAKNNLYKSDDFLKFSCSILRRVILSEVQKKDLELISNVLLYTYPSKKYSTVQKKIDFREKLGFTGPGSGVRVGYSGKGKFEKTEKNVRADLKSDLKSDPVDIKLNPGDFKLNPGELLRVHLLRLLFIMYNENISNILSQLSVTSSSNKDKDKEKEKERGRESPQVRTEQIKFFLQSCVCS